MDVGGRSADLEHLDVFAKACDRVTTSQADLLTLTLDNAAQQQRLALEADYIALRQRYVRLKIDYWHAVDAGDTARAELLSSEARTLADELKRPKQQ